MKQKLLIAAALLIASIPVASAQNDEKKDLPTIVEETGDRLQTTLGLEDWQVYKLDSTLLTCYTNMETESAQMHRAGVSNQDIYAHIADKWSEAIDSTLATIFTPEQWAKYMKTEFGRAKKSRDKRKAARESGNSR